MREKLLDINLDYKNTVDICEEDISSRDIAIIGTSVKFPLADNLESFWENLRSGRDCVREIPEERKQHTDDYLRFIGRKMDDIEYIPCGFLERIDEFDYSFFNISPREASLMDPHQRLFLETSWSTIENAGYGGTKLVGSRTGIYVGYSSSPFNSYQAMISEVDKPSIVTSVMGNLTPAIASRMAYILDFKGPSVVVDTTCSSSLVALHLACQGLKNGECDLAIAGGVNVYFLPVKSGLSMGIASSVYRARTFDDSSDGTVGGEGVGAVLLKPLDKALRDRDHIYAVIKGSAINQDGKSNGMSAPNPAAQGDVIDRALAVAGVDPETISYIEAHGTGTKLGDPIEIEGITRAFRKYTDRKNFCAVGSVKSNMGHLDSAAGIAGLIKAVMALYKKEIPATLHFKVPNRNIDFQDSPVYVINKLKKWEPDELPRRCGVSSFGLAGTNCHVILEEAPSQEISDCIPLPGLKILTLSAKSESSLKRIVEKYRGAIAESGKLGSLEDVCYTANTGRGHYSCRLAILTKSMEELREKLSVIGKSQLSELQAEGVFYGDCSNCMEEEKYPAPDNADDLKLHELCGLYVQGANIDWNGLYRNQKRRRVVLPSYPFERNSCWIKIPEGKHKSEPRKEMPFYYGTKWINKDLESRGADSLKGCIVVFGDGHIQEEITKSLIENGNSVVNVKLGKEYAKFDNNQYTVGKTEKDFYSLFSDIKTKGIKHILNLLPLESEGINNIGALDNWLESNAYSMLYMVKAILNNDIRDQINLVIMSRYTHKVNGKEKKVNPENNIISGLGKAIWMENPYLRCRCIDIDSNTESDTIIAELGAKWHDYRVAYRSGKRFVEVVDKITIPYFKSINFKQQGVYVITGGTGGLGLQMCSFLASKSCSNIALINRTKFPERDQWKAILQEGKETKLCLKIRQFMELESRGINISFYSADISSASQAKTVIEEIRLKFGKINGIIQSAGVGVGVREKGIGELDITEFRERLLPKVHGTMLLYQLTKCDNLDFHIMFSSVATMTGGAFSSGYIAANSYLDAFCHYGKMLGENMITINWPAWEYSLEEQGVDGQEYENLMKRSMFKPLSEKKAFEGLEEIINSSVEQAVIGEINTESEILIHLRDEVPFRLHGELLQTFEQRSVKKEDNSSTRENSSHKIELIGDKSGSYTITEQKLVKVLDKALGLTTIDINDDFYEIGGDSIIAIEVINLISKDMGVKVEISDLFASSSLRDFAKRLEEKQCCKLEGGPASLTAKEQVLQEVYPLSSQQKRIYFICQLDGNQISYNMPCIKILEGKMDIQRFESAFRQLIKRYDILRTSFVLKDGKPVQRIYGEVDFNLDFIEATEASIESMAHEFIRPFDLSQAPLLRVRLVRIAPEKHVFMMDIHHIVSDGVSQYVLMKDLMDIYTGNKLEELKMQYKDYSVWQNNYLFQSNEFNKQENYWLQKFSGKIPILEIPTDYVRPHAPSFDGRVWHFFIEGEKAADVYKAAKDAGTTLHMFLMSALCILFSKYAMSEDVIVGTVTTGRNRPEFECLAGMFVNTLAIRSLPEGNKQFIQYLGEIKQIMLEAYDNQDYQFEMLVEKLKLDRDLVRNPLFNVAFSLQNITHNKTGSGSFEKIIDYDFNVGKATFDLCLFAYQTEQGIHLALEYACDLFKEETVAKMAGHYLEVIEQVIINMQIKIKDISLKHDFIIVTESNVDEGDFVF